MSEAIAAPAVSARARSARRWLVGLTGAFILLLLVQAYLAGAFLMWDSDFRTAHVALGWSMTYWPFLMLGAAMLGKVDRRTWILFGIVFVLIHVQPFFVFLERDGMGWARALHPMNGVALVLLSHSLMRAALDLSRREARA